MTTNEYKMIRLIEEKGKLRQLIEELECTLELAYDEGNMVAHAWLTEQIVSLKTKRDNLTEQIDTLCV